jgi:hypothetical protein
MKGLISKIMLVIISLMDIKERIMGQIITTIITMEVIINIQVNQLVVIISTIVGMG